MLRGGAGDSGADRFVIGGIDDDPDDDAFVVVGDANVVDDNGIVDTNGVDDVVTGEQVRIVHVQLEGRFVEQSCRVERQHHSNNASVPMTHQTVRFRCCVQLEFAGKDKSCEKA